MSEMLPCSQPRVLNNNSRKTAIMPQSLIAHPVPRAVVAPCSINAKLQWSLICLLIPTVPRALEFGMCLFSESTHTHNSMRLLQEAGYLPAITSQRLANHHGKCGFKVCEICSALLFFLEVCNASIEVPESSSGTGHKPDGMDLFRAGPAEATELAELCREFEP